MLNYITSPERLSCFTEVDAMGQPRECTVCPEGTERCAHLGGDWVRIVYEEETGHWGVFWSWPAHAAAFGIFHGTEESAELTFDSLEEDLRHPESRWPAIPLAALDLPP